MAVNQEGKTYRHVAPYQNDKLPHYLGTYAEETAGIRKDRMALVFSPVFKKSPREGKRKKPLQFNNGNATVKVVFDSDIPQAEKLVLYPNTQCTIAIEVTPRRRMRDTAGQNRVQTFESEQLRLDEVLRMLRNPQENKPHELIASFFEKNGIQSLVPVAAYQTYQETLHKARSFPFPTTGTLHSDLRMWSLSQIGKDLIVGQEVNVLSHNETGRDQEFITVQTPRKNAFYQITGEGRSARPLIDETLQLIHAAGQPEVKPSERKSRKRFHTRKDPTASINDLPMSLAHDIVLGSPTFTHEPQTGNQQTRRNIFCTNTGDVFTLQAEYNKKIKMHAVTIRHTGSLGVVPDGSASRKNLEHIQHLLFDQLHTTDIVEAPQLRRKKKEYPVHVNLFALLQEEKNKGKTVIPVFEKEGIKGAIINLQTNEEKRVAAYSISPFDDRQVNLQVFAGDNGFVEIQRQGGTEVHSLEKDTMFVIPPGVSAKVRTNSQLQLFMIDSPVISHEEGKELWGEEVLHAHRYDSTSDQLIYKRDAFRYHPSPAYRELHRIRPDLSEPFMQTPDEKTGKFTDTSQVRETELFYYTMPPFLLTNAQAARELDYPSLTVLAGHIHPHSKHTLKGRTGEGFVGVTDDVKKWSRHWIRTKGGGLEIARRKKRKDETLYLMRRGTVFFVGKRKVHRLGSYTRFVADVVNSPSIKPTIEEDGKIRENEQYVVYV